MKRASVRALLASALLVGCGTTDDRPVTFEVVSLEILAPTCGAVQCHSTTTYLEGLAFDTLDACRESLRGGEAREILEVIDEQEMPPDSPMFENDIVLLEQWFAAGRPGL